MSTLTTTGARYALGLGASRRLQACASMEEASALYEGLRDTSGLGASRLPEGRIYDLSDSKPQWVAHVSYNGRVWQGRRWSEGSVCLFDPYGHGGKVGV